MIEKAEAAGKHGDEDPRSFKDWSLAAHPHKPMQVRSPLQESFLHCMHAGAEAHPVLEASGRSINSSSFSQHPLRCHERRPTSIWQSYVLRDADSHSSAVDADRA